MHAIAPMVKQSDFAFRTFVRDETPVALLHYSPMLVAVDVVAQGDAYVDRHLATNSTESSLVVQLAGSSGEALCAAANVLLRRHAHIAAFDVNLGCPQPDASARCYGAFLAKDVQKSFDCVSTLTQFSPIPG